MCCRGSLTENIYVWLYTCHHKVTAPSMHEWDISQIQHQVLFPHYLQVRTICVQCTWLLYLSMYVSHSYIILNAHIAVHVICLLHFGGGPVTMLIFKMSIHTYNHLELNVCARTDMHTKKLPYSFLFQTQSSQSKHSAVPHQVGKLGDYRKGNTAYIPQCVSSSYTLCSSSTLLL